MIRCWRRSPLVKPQRFHRCTRSLNDVCKCKMCTSAFSMDGQRWFRCRWWSVDSPLHPRRHRLRCLTRDRLQRPPWTSTWRHHHRLRPLQRQLLAVRHLHQCLWSSVPSLHVVDNPLAPSMLHADVSSSLTTAQIGWPYLPPPMGGPNSPLSGRWRLPPRRPIGGRGGGVAWIRTAVTVWRILRLVARTGVTGLGSARHAPVRAHWARSLPGRGPCLDGRSAASWPVRLLARSRGVFGRTLATAPAGGAWPRWPGRGRSGHPDAAPERVARSACALDRLLLAGPGMSAAGSPCALDVASSAARSAMARTQEGPRRWRDGHGSQSCEPSRPRSGRGEGPDVAARSVLASAATAGPLATPPLARRLPAGARCGLGATCSLAAAGKRPVGDGGYVAGRLGFAKP
jgi:hypothetical protein